MPLPFSRTVHCALVCTAALTACGGGGGSTSAPALLPAGITAPPATPTAASATPPAPAATTAAPPATPAAQLTGSVVDAAAMSPLGIASAVVRVGTTFAGGAPGGVIAHATSAADGTFSVPVSLAASLPALPAPLQPPSPYPQIPTPPPGTVATLFIEIEATGYATLHRVLYLSAGNVAAGAFGLVRPTSDELAALAQLNADRARLGNGAGVLPLGLDNDLVLTARFVATTMATDGFYAHRYPGTAEAVNVQYCAWPGFCSRYVAGPTENEDTGVASLVQAEAAYIAEGPSGGHFAAIVNSRNLWVGFGAASGGLCPDGVSRLCSYFTEEFALTADTP